MEDILKQLNKIFVDVFDSDAIVITANTTAKDIEEWDSLNNLQLIVAIEKHFKVKFTSGEILGWQNVGDMVNAIALKTK